MRFIKLPYSSFILPLSSFLLLSCGPAIRKTEAQPIPEKALQEQVQESSESPVFAQEEEWLAKNWWEQFQDPQLDQLINTSLAQNPNLKMADAQVRLVEATAQGVKSNLLPKISGNGDVTAEQYSKTGLFGAVPPASGIPLKFTQTEATLDFQYEMDWWGKNSNALAASLGEVRATKAERALSKQVLCLAVVQFYFQYQINTHRELLAQSFVANQQKLLDLAQSRVKDGLETEISLRQVEADLASAQMTLLAIQQEKTLTQNELKALLAGDFQQEFKVLAVPPEISSPFPLPKRLSLDLLAHRPDVTAQKWRVEAAMREVKVAKAGFYPNIDLIGFGGLQTIHFSELMRSESFFGAFGPAIHLPLFDGGELRANFSVKQEQYFIAVQQYDGLVLQAVKEVLNGLAVYQNTLDRLQEMRKVSQSRKSIYDLVQDRFQNHLSTRIDILRAENDWLSARQQEVVAQGESVQAMLGLIKALGTGYQGDSNDNS